MLDPQIAVLLAFVLPLIGMLGIWFFGEREYNARELMTLLTGIAVLYCTLTVFMAVQREDILEIKLATILPGLSLAFKVERLGAMFALIGSGLWIVNSLYSIGYMRGTKEKNQTRFYMCFAAAITAVIGIAYAANLITLFLFY
ncbi:MAG: monovalent cation/H+ antiporter subunit D family protein, partial [Parvularculaceae bacterium]